MKLVFLGVVALSVVLGLTNAMGYAPSSGYGYKQNYYHVPMPYLVGAPRQEGGGGGFCKFSIRFFMVCTSFTIV